MLRTSFLVVIGNQEHAQIYIYTILPLLSWIAGARSRPEETLAEAVSFRLRSTHNGHWLNPFLPTETKFSLKIALRCFGIFFTFPFLPSPSRFLFLLVSFFITYFFHPPSTTKFVCCPWIESMLLSDHSISFTRFVRLNKYLFSSRIVVIPLTIISFDY